MQRGLPQPALAVFSNTEIRLVSDPSSTPVILEVIISRYLRGLLPYLDQHAYYTAYNNANTDNMFRYNPVTHYYEVHLHRHKSTTMPPVRKTTMHSINPKPPNSVSIVLTYNNRAEQSDGLSQMKMMRMVVARDSRELRQPL
jgi:hypothetical protein